MSSYLKLGVLIKMVTLVDFYEVKLRKKKEKKRYDSEFDDDDNMLPEITFSNQTHCAERSLLTGETSASNSRLFTAEELKVTAQWLLTRVKNNKQM